MGGEGSDEVDSDVGVGIASAAIVGGGEEGFWSGVSVKCGGGSDFIERVVVCDEGGSGGETTGWTVAVIRGGGDRRRLSREWLLLEL